MNNAETIIKNVTTAIKAMVKPKIEDLEARIAALEKGSEADSLLHSRIKLLESENAALTRRLALRIAPQKKRA